MEELTNAKLPEHIEKSINNVLKKEAFVSYKITSNLLPADGGNYMGELYEITIKGQTAKGEKEFNIFVKNIPNVGESITSFYDIANAYKIECFFYKELAKTIAKLEIDANVPVNERFKSVKIYEESTNEAILLDNLIKKGFRSIGRMQIVPLEFIEQAMSQVAKIHAMTFIIQKMMPEFFNTKIESLSYPVSFNEHWYNFFQDLSKAALKSLSEDKKQEVKDMLPTAIENYRKSYEDISFRVLCHGDFRANNTLFREEEGEIQEVIPIDYQVVHYGNPANDLLHFLYGSNDREFRKQHMKHLIESYYTSVGKYLEYFDIDISDVYPRKSLEDSLKARLDVGALIAVCYYPLMYASEDSAPKISDLGTVPDLDANVVKKIEDVLDEVVDMIRSSTPIWE